MATITTDAETITLTEIAELLDVAPNTASDMLRRGLFPAPLPSQHRTRKYRFPRDEALAAVMRIKQARAVLAGNNPAA